MRIYGSNATAQVANASAPRRAASGGFSVDEARRRNRRAPAASLRTIGGIDALIALQGQDDPAERRRRAVKRGRNALDALDELKLGVLGGTLGPFDAAAAEVGDGRACATPPATTGSTGAGRDRAAPRGRDRQDGPAAVAPAGSLPRFQARLFRISGCHYSVLVGHPAAHYKLAPRAGRLVRVGWGRNEE